MVWRARKLLTSALRSSAALALGLARQRAPVPEHRLRRGSLTAPPLDGIKIQEIEFCLSIVALQ